MDKDDGVRPDISVATLGALKPVFKKGGTTTAGNSSQVSPKLCAARDGALLPATLTSVRGSCTSVQAVRTGCKPSVDTQSGAISAEQDRSQMCHCMESSNQPVWYSSV